MFSNCCVTYIIISKNTHFPYKSKIKEERLKSVSVWFTPETSFFMFFGIVWKILLYKFCLVICFCLHLQSCIASSNVLKIHI